MKKSNCNSFYVRVVKRVADFIIGLAALPFLLAIIAVVGIAIKLDDGGPIFYKAKRIGKNSKIFDMYKFRSMIVNAPNWIIRMVAPIMPLMMSVSQGWGDSSAKLRSMRSLSF